MEADFVSDVAEDEYAAVVRAADRLVVGIDFDGTLAPIVEDPAGARIHPEAGEVLLALSSQVRALAVVTGRPVRTVLDLGDLEDLGRRVDEQGRELLVLGQYGNERWSSRDLTVHVPDPPEGLAALREELPGLLAGAGCPEAWLEEKGLAVGVHTRRLPDAEAAYETLLPVLTEAAHRHDLTVEPGRLSIEIRGAGTDKGTAVRALLEEVEADAVVFVGDDRGDLEAFRVVDERREERHPGLKVCSTAEGHSPLEQHADVVVAGPDGVLAFLRQLRTDIRARRV